MTKKFNPFAKLKKDYKGELEYHKKSMDIAMEKIKKIVENLQQLNFEITNVKFTQFDIGNQRYFYGVNIKYNSQLTDEVIDSIYEVNGQDLKPYFDSGSIQIPVSPVIC